MSSLTLNRELSRQVDADAVAELGLPSLLLMENAARGAVQQLLPRCQQESQIVILAGPGNNGGRWSGDCPPAGRLRTRTSGGADSGRQTADSG